MATPSSDALKLLYIRNGDFTARWNYPDTIGSTPASGAGIGNDVDISFSFPTSLPAHAVGSIGGFLKFTTAQKDGARAALASIEDIANIDFHETTSLGQVTFANSAQQQGQGGYAYTPNYAYRTSDGRITSVTESKTAGDVWINRNEAWDTDAWKPGGEGYATLLHELGHALGLRHSFGGGNNVASWIDSENYTVMSYTSAARSTLVEVTGSQNSYSWSLSKVQPTTLMMLDIEALQYLYGANTSTRSGNTTYKWDTSEELLETIWDGGGRDTIDVSNQVFTCVINLEAPAFCSVGLRQTSAEIRAGLGLPSWFTQALPQDIYDGSNNLAIARGVVIENVLGSSARDLVTGNAADNLLAGNAGNDTLSGSSGDDTLNGGTGADSMTGGSGNDRYYVDNASDIVKESSSGGRDLVFSYLTGYTLGSQVEDGRVMSGGTANLTGNGGGNAIYAGTGNNVLAGGSGTDTLSYEYGAGRGVTASLASTAAQATGGSGTDKLSGFENVTGSKYADKLTGSSSANVIAGGAGNDTLAGGSGNDTLVGGGGRDSLAGGSGNDVFDFNSLVDSGTSTSTRDVITDFIRGQDHIDLATLDANASRSGNNAFVFIGKAAFSADASGQLRYVYDSHSKYGVLYGSTDPDSAPEFSVQVDGIGKLSAADIFT